MTFPGYSKYVSRIFDTKEDAMEDKRRYRDDVLPLRPYAPQKVAGSRQTRKPTLPWRAAGTWLPERKNPHEKVEEESVFVVKTLKLTDEEGAQNIIQRKEDVRKSARNATA